MEQRPTQRISDNAQAGSGARTSEVLSVHRGLKEPPEDRMVKNGVSTTKRHDRRKSKGRRGKERAKDN